MDSPVLAGRSILLVEKELPASADTGQLLRAAGATVFVASHLEHALHIAERPELSVGVLDFELASGDCTAVCWRLTDRRIPFLFYGARPYSEFRQWPQAPVLIKPMTDRLIAAVAGLFR